MEAIRRERIIIRYVSHFQTSQPAMLAAEAAWTPPIDVYETSTWVIVEVCLAGVDPESVHLEYSNRALHLSGKRGDYGVEKPRGYYVLEIERGPFARSIQLPAPVDPERVEATFKHGMLVVRLPKRSGQIIPACSKADFEEGFE